MALNITGRKLFVKALKEEGVDTIFAYPGGMITDIVDELYKTEDIKVEEPEEPKAENKEELSFWQKLLKLFGIE